MTPAEILTSLQHLSAPGFNRAIGSGDVSPYRSSTDPTAIGGTTPTASDAVAATPGASGMWGTPTPAPVDPNSWLSNLSAFTPLINQLLAQQAAAAVPSGQGNAQAQPANQAQNGLGSQDIASSSPAVPAPSAPVPAVAPVAPSALPYGTQLDPYAYSANALTGGEGGPGAAAGAGAPGGGTGTGGEGGSGGVGSGAAGGGVYKKGGLITRGNPQSKTDDVPAMLQHGEYVIPREDVRALAHHAVDHAISPRATHEQVDQFFSGGVPADLDERSDHAGTAPGPAFKYSRGGYVAGGPIGSSAPAPSGLGRQIAERISTLDPTRRAAAVEDLNTNILGRIAQGVAAQKRALAAQGLAGNVARLAQLHNVPMGGAAPVAAAPAPAPVGIPRQMASMAPSGAVQGRPASVPPLHFAQGGAVPAVSAQDQADYEEAMRQFKGQAAPQSQSVKPAPQTNDDNDITRAIYGSHPPANKGGYFSMPGRKAN